ncbi:hypothetical protein [Pontibacter sp. SGAir0037]|uniref:hypothetical protein n=1 Tax=Pontibacter sp. SGAir0037 TaxID=2571030 RepID=UPI0010CD1D1C|nr:hypothetical protein [Pontibacter sp. SGAir0037]QCR23258.1 hypothetical protein C1N53_13530 [Pontibacter sp. SGAir0037]
MKNIVKTIFACCLLFAGSTTLAQQATPPVKASLDAAPATVEQATTETLPVTRETESTPAATLPLNRFSYGLSLGSSFGSGFGATFAEPSVRHQVSDRFRVFGSFTYMNVMSQQYTMHSPEGGTVVANSGPSNHYIVNAGVDYLASDRLILSGSVWKDFSNVPAPNPLYNGLFQPSRQGADFRATYKITENLSVTGGVRYSNGGSPMQGLYGPGLGGYRSSAWW